MTADKKADGLLIRDQAASLGQDMDFISAHRHNPFFINGKANPDAYIEFVTGYNEFINHQPKPFTRMIDTVMKL